MFIKYKFIHADPNIANTLYLSVEDVEINESLHSCIINMPHGYTAYIYENDTPAFIEALERGDHIIDFNQFGDDSEFCNRYGDRLLKAKGDN